MRFQCDLTYAFPRVRKTLALNDLLLQLRTALTSTQSLPKSSQETAQLLLLYELSVSPQNGVVHDFIDFERRSARIAILTDMSGTREDMRLFRWIRNWWETKSYHVEINGAYPLFAQMQSEVGKTLMYSLLFTSVILFFVLMLLFRSMQSVCLLWLANIMPIVAVLRWMGWLNIPIDLGIATAMAVAVGIAVDDTLHLAMRYRRCMRQKHHHQTCLSATYEETGRGIAMTTLVVVALFSCLIVSRFVPNQDFGIVVVLAALSAFWFDVVLLPSGLKRIKSRKDCDVTKLGLSSFGYRFRSGRDNVDETLGRV